MSKRESFTLDDADIEFIEQLVIQGRREYRGVMDPKKINKSSVVRSLIKKARSGSKRDLIRELESLNFRMEEVKKQIAELNSNGVYEDEVLRILHIEKEAEI